MVKAARAVAPPLFHVLRFAVRCLFLLLFNIEVRGQQHIPRIGGYIIAANHLSWLDIFLLMTTFPATPRITFIAAREEVFHSRFRVYMTTRVGYVIPVDRQSGRIGRDLIAAVAAALDAGMALVIFPEGDVSDIETGTLKPFKKGMGFFAVQTGAPILPVAFRGTKDLYVRKRVEMTIGAPIAGVAGGGRAAADTQTVRVADAIAAMLEPPAPEPTRGIAGWFGRHKFFQHTLTHMFTTQEGSLESRLAAQKEADGA